MYQIISNYSNLNASNRIFIFYLTSREYLENVYDFNERLTSKTRASVENLESRIIEFCKHEQFRKARYQKLQREKKEAILHVTSYFLVDRSSASVHRESNSTVHRSTMHVYLCARYLHGLRLKSIPRKRDFPEIQLPR